MHTYRIELVVHQRINQIKEIVITSSHSLKQDQVLDFKKFFCKYYGMQFHIMSIDTNIYFVFLPDEKITAEPVSDLITLLDVIHNHAKKILPNAEIEVCMTFSEVSQKKMMRFETEKRLKLYAKKIFALQKAIGDTSIHSVDDEKVLKSNLNFLLAKAKEAKMLLNSL